MYDDTLDQLQARLQSAQNRLTELQNLQRTRQRASGPYERMIWYVIRPGVLQDIYEQERAIERIENFIHHQEQAMTELPSAVDTSREIALEQDLRRGREALQQASTPTEGNTLDTPPLRDSPIPVSPTDADILGVKKVRKVIHASMEDTLRSRPVFDWLEDLHGQVLTEEAVALFAPTTPGLVLIQSQNHWCLRWERMLCPGQHEELCLGECSNLGSPPRIDWEAVQYHNNDFYRGRRLRNQRRTRVMEDETVLLQVHALVLHCQAASDTLRATLDQYGISSSRRKILQAYDLELSDLRRKT